MSDLKAALECKRDELAQMPHLTDSGRGRMTFKNGFDACLELLWPVIDAVERLREHHRAWINGARADLVYERMEKEFDAITALRRELDGRGDG